jgi:hypothetical protein
MARTNASPIPLNANADVDLKTLVRELARQAVDEQSHVGNYDPLTKPQDIRNEEDA